MSLEKEKMMESDGVRCCNRSSFFPQCRQERKWLLQKRRGDGVVWVVNDSVCSVDCSSPRYPQVAVIPIVIGVAMAWYSEMEISRSAVWVSVVCIVLNAIKVVINSEMLTGEYKVRLFIIYTYNSNSNAVRARDTKAVVLLLCSLRPYGEAPILMPSVVLLSPGRVIYLEKQSS